MNIILGIEEPWMVSGINRNSVSALKVKTLWIAGIL